MYPEAPLNHLIITLEELNKHIKKLQNNRAAGVDEIPAEAIKWLDQTNRPLLLRILKPYFTITSAPSEWNIARAVAIYKKGPVTNKANYRGLYLADGAGKSAGMILAAI